LIVGGPHNEGELQTTGNEDDINSPHNPEDTESAALDTVTMTTTLLSTVTLAGTQSGAHNFEDYFSLTASL
jgi:hypothetical protein